MDRRRFVSSAAAPAVGMGWIRGASSAQAPKALDAAAFHASRRFASTRFGRIAYVERGNGPVALFLHGFPLNGFQWRGLLERLSPYRRCLAPDFVGLGYTESPDQEDFSPQAQADMLAALLDELLIPAVDLVANDSGLTIAQLFVVQHPGRVRTMLFTNGDVHENSPPVQMRNSIDAARAGRYDQKMARHLQDPMYARSPQGIGGSAYANPANFTDEAIEVYFGPLVSTPLRRTQLNRYLAAFEPNPLVAIEPALRRITAPTRMLWGTADPLFPVVWAEWLDRPFPAPEACALSKAESCSGRRSSPT
ncbi:MAG: alpha/beta hydrolase [Pseudoxanthomonas sp.]